MEARSVVSQSEPDFNAALQDARKATRVAQDLADHYRAQLDQVRAELDRYKRRMNAILKAIDEARI